MLRLFKTWIHNSSPHRELVRGNQREHQHREHHRRAEAEPLAGRLTIRKDREREERNRDRGSQAAYDSRSGRASGVCGPRAASKARLRSTDRRVCASRTRQSIEYSWYVDAVDALCGISATSVALVSVGPMARPAFGLLVEGQVGDQIAQAPTGDLYPAIDHVAGKLTVSELARQVDGPRHRLPDASVAIDPRHRSRARPSFEIVL